MDAVTQSLNCGGCSSSYTVDASHTANYYLDPVTAGVSYTTVSGNTYFTPSIPEPSSMLLLGTGFAAVSGCLRRRRFALWCSTKAATGLIMAMCLLGSGVIASAQQLKIVSFDAPGADTNPGDYNGTVASSINNRGAVTGFYVDVNNVYHGFVRSRDGRFTTFDAPGADTTPNSYNGTAPAAVNDVGEITGNYWDASGYSHGFLRRSDGTFTTFDVPGAGGYGSTPLALNWEEAVVGIYTDQNYLFHAFVRNPDGTFATWVGPGACDTNGSQGCYGSGASNINGFGIIVGGYEDNRGNFVHHSYVRDPAGTLKTFDVPGAGTGRYQGTGCPGCALGFNQFGAVAGTYIDANSVQHGFVRSRDGGFTKFDAPGAGTGSRQGTGCPNDCPTSLNDWGAITGTYIDASNVYHGYLRSPAGKVVTVDPRGSVFTLSSGINDFGVITGYYQDANNVYHGFLAVQD